MDFYLDIIGNIGIWVILALSLNVIVGMTGMLQLGHAGFFAVGAYTAGLVGVYGQQWLSGLGLWAFVITVPAAMAAAVLSALVIGIPCLRLRGDYLAIATLAFGEIVQKLLKTLTFPGSDAMQARGQETFGGASGVPMPLDLSIDALVQPTGGVELLDPATAPIGSFLQRVFVLNAQWWVILLAMAVTWVILLRLKKSAMGRAMLAIREDEIAARAMGVNVPVYKTMSFAICAAFAGLAGALFAHKNIFLSPGSFGLLLTIEILLAVVLGGLGSLSGSVLAAILIVIVPQFLAQLPPLVVTDSGMMMDTAKYEINIPLGFAALREHLPMVPDVGRIFRPGTQKELIFAFLFILLVRFVPNGIMGMLEPQDYVRRWRRRREARGAAEDAPVDPPTEAAAP